MEMLTGSSLIAITLPSATSGLSSGMERMVVSIGILMLIRKRLESKFTPLLVFLLCWEASKRKGQGLLPACMKQKHARAGHATCLILAATDVASSVSECRELADLSNSVHVHTCLVLRSFLFPKVGSSFPAGLV